MKGKLTMTITIGIMCTVLLYVMLVQFKTVEETDITEIENMREGELRTGVANWKTKYEDVSKKYEETTKTIREYEDKITNNQEASELLQEELERANMLLGKTDVQGEGIVITLSDNREKKIEIYDILQLINELKLAGAEAISINDERIIATTDIKEVNSMYIVVDGKRITSPYVVKAIGNQTYLESGLTTKDYGYIDRVIKAYDKTATVERQDNVKILKYAGEMKLQYAE